LLLQARAAPDGQQWARVDVGSVVVIAAPDQIGLGTSLAEAAAPSREWLALGRIDPAPITLIVARDRAAFALWSRGRVPRWGGGLAATGSRTIVIRVDAGDPFGTLRHELAHLALHQRIRVRVPLWFDEGFAVLAAGEYGRLDALRLNVAVASGRIPGLGGVDAALRGAAQADAEAAYALAATAVAELARRNPSGTLEPLIAQLVAGASFDAAVEATTGFTADRFDEAWHRSVRRRYNWGIWFATGGVWVIIALAMVGASAWRRRRDGPRRAALDIGWPEPVPDDEDDNLINIDGAQLDRPDNRH